jgi:hypothetical protein
MLVTVRVTRPACAGFRPVSSWPTGRRRSLRNGACIYPFQIERSKHADGRAAVALAASAAPPQLGLTDDQVSEFWDKGAPWHNRVVTSDGFLITSML